MSDSSPDAMTREELEEEVGELRGQVGDMRTDIAFLKKAVTTLTDADLGDEMGIAALSGFAESTREEIEDHGTAIESLEAHVTNADQVGQRPSTKKELAESIIQNEAVRVANKGIRGGAIDYPTIRDIAERQQDTVLNSGTVYTAFDDLAAKWECFEVESGGDGPNTKNKHLRVERVTIPPALENLAGNAPVEGGVRREGN